MDVLPGERYLAVGPSTSSGSERCRIIDESGHDHKNAPYEVRGGFAIPASRLWQFVQQLRSYEFWCFGDHLHEYGSEIKGSKLLKKNRFEWADRDLEFDDSERQDLSKKFLERGRTGESPKWAEFAAYGKASIEMARKVFDTIDNFGGTAFASAIPRGVQPPKGFSATEYLRKDHVYLLERYYYFLEERDATGLIVMDESDENLDRSFIHRMRRYFTNTGKGQKRLTHIVPLPLFVTSELTYPVQAADVVIYCLNWGFRLASRGMTADARENIAEEFGWRLSDLQYYTDHSGYDGRDYNSYGICYVEDPYS